MNEEELKTFGKYIKNLREELGLTLSELAEKIGYSNPYLSQLETGKRKRPPTPEFLKHLAQGLEVPYSELLRRAGYKELAKGQLYAEIAHSEKLHVLEQFLDEKATLGEALKTLREIYNYSLGQIAENTGIPISHIRDLEEDRVETVDQKTLSLIARQYESDYLTVFETLLNIATSNGLSESYPIKPELLTAIRKHRQDVELQISISRAKDSIVFLDDTLTKREKKMVYDFIELLIKNRTS